MDLFEKLFCDPKIARIFRIAAKAAERAAEISNVKYQIGAVLTRNGRILGIGYNRNNVGFRIVRGTRERNGRYWGLHAEIAAIRDALKRCRIDLNFDLETVSPSALDLLDGTSIWVFRAYKKSRYPALAKPCLVCRTVLPQLGVVEAIYTIPQPPYYNRDPLITPS